MKKTTKVDARRTLPLVWYARTERHKKQVTHTCRTSVWWTSHKFFFIYFKNKITSLSWQLTTTHTQTKKHRQFRFRFRRCPANDGKEEEPEAFQPPPPQLLTPDASIMSIIIPNSCSFITRDGCIIGVLPCCNNSRLSTATSCRKCVDRAVWLLPSKAPRLKEKNHRKTRRKLRKNKITLLLLRTVVIITWLDLTWPRREKIRTLRLKKLKQNFLTSKNIKNYCKIFC